MIIINIRLITAPTIFNPVTSPLTFTIADLALAKGENAVDNTKNENKVTNLNIL